MSEILQVHNLKKYFKTKYGMLHAVDDVTFSLEKGENLGVVGESGCGKSTLGRTILGLTEATEGQVLFKGEDITHLSKKERRKLFLKMQIIFQDPFSSIDPRMNIWSIIADPLKINHIYHNKAEIDKRVWELMDTVGLARRLTYAYPHELDGGRRQRVGIARALALDPEFIVCDEPVSALDVSIQAQILNLLQDLQKENGLTYIFITHDLSVVRHISNNILVMYSGCVVEKAESKELFKRPLHPYTRGLISAIPTPDIDAVRKRIIMQGEVTASIDPKPGCRFAGRCPYAEERCREEMPPLREAEPGHFVACYNIKQAEG